MQLSEALPSPVVTVVHCGIGAALVQSSDIQAHGMDLNGYGSAWGI